MRLLRKQRKRVLMGRSDVAGWGIFLQRAADKDDLNSRSSVGTVGTGLGSLACLKDQGHMVILDQASGAPDPVPISALAELLEIAEDVFANIANGVLRVRVNHKYPLSQAPQAHLVLESRTTTGSIVLIPDGVES
ncbi:hypothetical protein Tco_0443067 [Tanacetum coccineum]